MKRIRYPNIAAKITGFMALFWMLGVLAGIYALYLLGNELDWVVFPLALGFAFVVDFLSLRLVLPTACKKYDVFVLKEGRPITPHGTALLGLAWGLMWRLSVVSIPLNLIRNIVADSESTLYLDVLTSLAGFFFASLWLLKHQLGSTTIGRVEVSSKAVYDHETQKPVVEDTNAFKIAKEGTIGILATAAVLSYFAVGFVQLAAIVSFFHDYWGWWYIPSFLVAMFVAYIPLIGAGAGMYAAVEVWHWAWYLAGLLFFFPIALGVLVAGGVGFVELITSKFKR